MELLKLSPFFLFFSILCIFVAAKPEPASHCLRSGPTIRFPFLLTDQNRLGLRSYPGFNLISCGANNETIIHLQSVPFIIREINYIAQQIRINDDPDFTCLPEKILSLNLSGTPFRGAFNQEFSFFSCSPGHRPGLQPILCLSNSTRSVFATSSSPTVRSDLFGQCDLVKTVSVPVRFLGFGEVLSSSLDQDLVLQWESPGCRDCEARGGRCGLEDGPSLEIGCFFDPEPGDGHQRGLRIFFLVCAAFWFVIVAYCIGCEWFSEEPNIIITNHPELGPKSELGDSGRLLNPDEPWCPICLSGFKPQEIPKTLHLCQHSFHARCIDQWLLRNITCPVCRHTTVTVV